MRFTVSPINETGTRKPGQSRWHVRAQEERDGKTTTYFQPGSFRTEKDAFNHAEKLGELCSTGGKWEYTECFIRSVWLVAVSEC